MTEKELIDKYTVNKIKWDEICRDENLTEEFIEKY